MVRFIFNLNWFVFSVLTASSKLNKKDQWSVITPGDFTASPWLNVILCKILECHRSTSLSFLSHTSPWYPPSLLNVKWCANTWFSPLHCHCLSDHNHSRYFIVPCIWEKSATLSNGVLHKRWFINSFACAFSDNYWAVDRKSTRWWEDSDHQILDRSSAVFSMLRVVS